MKTTATFVDALKYRADVQFLCYSYYQSCIGSFWKACVPNAFLQLATSKTLEKSCFQYS